MNTILKVANLTKNFGALTAVSDLSFTIEKGNVYGILGPNGSGKSTTLGIVLNVVNKTSGDFSWFDGNTSTHHALKKVGAIIERPNFTNMTAGSHYLAITNSNGCIRTIDFEVVGYDPLVITAEQRGINEITAIATGGREEYTFYFAGTDNGDDNTFSIKSTGTYEVSVIDENGCEAVTSIYIEFIDIEIPNFFTPNNDGNNDLWIPENVINFPNIYIIIYDRYGREVYRLIDNPNGWDGLYKNNELPTGDYWYIIKLNGEDDTREFVGHFTLYR